MLPPVNLSQVIEDIMSNEYFGSALNVGPIKYFTLKTIGEKNSLDNLVIKKHNIIGVPERVITGVTQDRAIEEVMEHIQSYVIIYAINNGASHVHLGEPSYHHSGHYYVPIIYFGKEGND